MAKTLFEQSGGDEVFRKKLQSEPCDSRGQPLSDDIPVSGHLEMPRIIDDKLHFSPVPKKVKPGYDCDGYKPRLMGGLIPITFLFSEVACRLSDKCNTFQLGLMEHIRWGENSFGVGKCSGYRKGSCNE